MGGRGRAGRAALSDGRVVVAVGEAGSGRATLLAQAQRRARRTTGSCRPGPRRRTTSRPGCRCGRPRSASPTPPSSCAASTDCPAWAAQRLASLVRQAPHGDGQVGLPFAMTAERFEDLPAPLAALVDTVVQVAPLRERPADVLPLARHAAAACPRPRGRLHAGSGAGARQLRLAGQRHAARAGRRGRRRPAPTLDRHRGTCRRELLSERRAAVAHRGRWSATRSPAC